jgi:hypothetical protein
MALLIVDLDKRIGNAETWHGTFKEQLPDLEIRFWPEAGNLARLCAFLRWSDSSALGPKDILGSDELESPIDGEFGRPEWAAGDPAFLPQRPVKHVEAPLGLGRPQPGERCAGSGII